MTKVLRLFLLFFLCSSIFAYPADLLWKRGLKSEIAGSPACYNGRIIVLVRNGDIHCFKGNSELLWSKNFKSAIFSSPAIDQKGNISVATLDGRYLKLNMDGEVRLESKFNAKFRSTPLILEDQIILCSEKGKVFSVGRGDGKIIWEKKFDNECFSSPVFDRGTIYIPMKNNALFALSVEGEIKWEFRTKGVIFSSPAIASDGSIYITGMDHQLYKITPNGKLRWKFKAGRWIISSPVIDIDGNVYFGSYDRYFYSVNSRGKLRWKYKGRGSFNATPAIDSKGIIYTGNSSGYVYKFSSVGKLIWKYKTGDFVRKPFAIIPGENILIFGALDKNIYAFKTEGTLSKKGQWPKYMGNSSNSGKK